MSLKEKRQQRINHLREGHYNADGLMLASAVSIHNTIHGTRLWRKVRTLVDSGSVYSYTKKDLMRELRSVTTRNVQNMV